MIAIGQVATGVIAIGQMATGVIAIGQLARGVFAIGMIAFGLVSFGMAAVGIGWAGGMVTVASRVRGLVPVSLGPTWPTRVSAPWGAVSVFQLGALVGLSVLVWKLGMVPLGDALFGPNAILRSGG